MSKLSLVCVVAVVAYVSAAPLYGGAQGGMNGQGVGMNVEMQARGLKAALYLFAPQSWIDAWNAIPQEGQECFFKMASDPANQQVFESDDMARVKEQVQTSCPSASAQIGSFADAMEATTNSLPASFTDAAKSWGQQIKQIGESLKQQAGNAQGFGQPAMGAGQAGPMGAGLGAGQGAMNSGMGAGSAAFKQMISQFSAATATFTGKLAALSESDRQQIGNAFPKLQPFISGPNSVEFLNQMTQLYQTIGSGNVDSNAIKAQAQQMKGTLQTIWQQYSTQNADGLKQAGDLLGKDLTKVGNFMQTGAAQSGMGGGMHPEFASMMGGPVDEASNNAFNNFKKQHSMNGEASFGQNGGALNVQTQ